MSSKEERTSWFNPSRPSRSLTSYGLRSLNSDNPAYHGDYGGDQYQRDSGYHQGPAWAWLMGAYAEAHMRVYGDPLAALACLEPFAYHLSDASLGSVSDTTMLSKGETENGS